MTPTVDTIIGERHGAFGRTEEIFEMIRFTLVVVVLFVSEKIAIFLWLGRNHLTQMYFTKEELSANGSGESAEFRV